MATAGVWSNGFSSTLRAYQLRCLPRMAIWKRQCARSNWAPSISSPNRSTCRVCASSSLLRSNCPSTNDADTSVFGPRLLGTSSAMQHLREMIARVARSQAPVHIYGESGTGKELVAKLIHESGPRRDGPFVPVNCGAIPTELMESELFGHKRGSFTGAVSDKKGSFSPRRAALCFSTRSPIYPPHAG